MIQYRPAQPAISAWRWCGGITVLALGLIYHLVFMRELRRTREEMTTTGLIHGQSRFPVSLTFVTALMLLALGLSAILSMTFGIGPLD